MRSRLPSTVENAPPFAVWGRAAACCVQPCLRRRRLRDTVNDHAVTSRSCASSSPTWSNTAVRFSPVQVINVTAECPIFLFYAAGNFLQYAVA